MPEALGKRFAAGVRLGPYEIVDLIGVGGMGEVYRARDSRLDRIVAVKVLSAGAPDLRKARSRFAREARVISSLSHPHICAIYDVGRDEDVDYIVMEYIEGEPLSRRLERRALRLDQAMQFAVQIASALAEAHRAGIVHRDLKPANVMLTASGAKLLDFGLAKYAAEEVAPTLTSSDTLTGEGQLVGTLPYMSPEQVEGKEADARSDIFAFGSMLHEMITQQRAFDGSQVHLIAAILSSDPPPPSSLQVLCPPELDHLVARCLAKDPAERWQSAQDLLLELRWAIGRSPAIGTPRRRSLRTLAWTAGVAVATALVVAAATRRQGDTPFHAPASHQVTMSSGWESDPALSPDGGLIAYASDESGNADVWIVDARGGNAIRLTDDPAADTDPAWFPDGSALVFSSDRGGRTSIWKVLRFGGAPSLLVPGADEAAISPDGARVAFTRVGSNGKLRVWTAPVNDPAGAQVLTSDGAGLWDHHAPAFSPDGRTICYHGERDLWLISTDGSNARRLTHDDEADVQPAWSSDGKHVYFSSLRGGAWALWRVAAEGGAPQRLTFGTGPERSPSISRDGRRLAYSTLSPTVNLMFLDLASRKEATLPGLNATSLSWAPDGRSLVFAAARIGGRFDLWVQPLARDQPAGPLRRLTDHVGSVARPAFSPDGRWVAYYRVVGGQRDIWTVPIAGGQPIQFTDDSAADLQPSWSPNGDELAFASERGGGASHIWIAPVAEGRPAGPARRLTSGETAFSLPAWSPDGRWIAYVGDAPSGSSDVWVVDALGQQTPRMLATGGRASRVTWDHTSRALFVGGRWDSWVSLRKYALESGGEILLEPRIRLGQNPRLNDFDVSRDGRIVVFGRDELRGDVWALEAPDRVF